LAAAKKQEALWQWDTTTGEHHWRFQEPETGSRDGAPRPLVSFSEGQTIAWGAGNKVILGNPQTHQVTATLEGHFEDVTALAFSPDGRYLASGAFDKTIVLWDLSTHEEIRTFYGHLLQVKSLAFSPDGRVLASAAADRTVRLWEPDTGHQIAILGTPPDGEEMWEFKVLSARREERLSALLNTWTTKAGRSFLLVTIRFKNKLEEPNLFYIPGGLAVSDGQETYPCKGLEMFGILEEGRYFRSYLEAESESSQTLIFVVPTTARGLTLRFLNLAPMVVN
jgi:WD40 repeat protein